jgi:GntR family transcriptional regulator, carbon starvation induced regulator
VTIRESSVQIYRSAANAPEGAGRSTQASSVYEQMREDIVACRILPDEKMQMEALRAKYGVGLSPIREALNRLFTEGLVTQVDQKGFRAAPMSLAELEDVTLARRWIGMSALKASMEHGGADWEERILLAHHRWERGLKESSAEGHHSNKIHRLHSDFHLALLSACGSDWMLGFWVKAFDFAQRYQVMSIRSGFPSRRDPVKEHRDLMEAVLAHDLERSLALHDRHLEITASLVREIAASGSGLWTAMEGTDTRSSTAMNKISGE